MFADLNEVNAVLEHCQTDYIEVLYDASDKVFPVLGCKGTKFPSKSKFSRHWEERHKLTTTKYLCSVSGCLAECRRRSDMKTHIRRVHESNAEKAKFILPKCEVQHRENRGYLDPGLYVFKGGCINGAVTAVTQDLCGQEEDSGSSPTTTAATQNHQEEEEEDSPASKAVTLVDREA